MGSNTSTFSQPNRFPCKVCKSPNTVPQRNWVCGSCRGKDKGKVGLEANTSDREKNKRIGELTDKAVQGSRAAAQDLAKLVGKGQAEKLIKQKFTRGRSKNNTGGEDDVEVIYVSLRKRIFG